jgi:hypothetical protein
MHDPSSEPTPAVGLAIYLTYRPDESVTVMKSRVTTWMQSDPSSQDCVWKHSHYIQAGEEHAIETYMALAEAQWLLQLTHVLAPSAEEWTALRANFDAEGPFPIRPAEEMDDLEAS